MASASLGGDVFEEDETTNEFQSLMAAQCGLEAGAFVVSGTMANHLAIQTLLTQPPCRVLVDSRSHIAAHIEEGGLGMSGASLQSVRPSNGRYLVLEDIMTQILVTSDVNKGPTRVISIENTTSFRLRTYNPKFRSTEVQKA
ncbi:pyridoxal phosphate-dependent transferase, partial [Aspergillus foveolatus]|uniref:pyridoxal phosphate-dependent transferase n=1 Tax=Aspergillus foveolatus TaxID=210207 RepID=UPI003CCDF93B